MIFSPSMQNFMLLSLNEQFFYQSAQLIRGRILVQVTIYRRLLIGRDGHLDQSEAYDISQLAREYGPW